MPHMPTCWVIHETPGDCNACVQIRFVQVSIVHSILHSGLVHNTNVDNANMKMQAGFFDGGKLGLAKSTSMPLHP